MSLLWLSMIFYSWIFSNIVKADCGSSTWTDIAPECNHTDDAFTPTIAIQTFSANNYPYDASYATLSLFIKGSNGLNIMPHCVIMDTDDDMSITVVRKWILHQKPWPRHHNIGNVITFNHIHSNMSQFIVFNNPCVINQNTTNKHAIILVFNQNFSSWNIQSDPYNNCEDKSINTMYDTLYDMNCSLLPIESNLNWNFQIPQSTLTAAPLVYIPSFSIVRTFIYAMIVVFANISGGAILYSILNGKQNKIQNQIQQILSQKHLDTNTNTNSKVYKPVLTLKLSTPNPETAELILSTTVTPKKPPKAVQTAIKTFNNRPEEAQKRNKIRISIMDDRLEHSLASLPPIPHNKNRSVSANELHAHVHHRNESTVTYLMPALSEHNAALSELDDSILNDDYHNHLDDVLDRINSIKVTTGIQIEDKTMTDNKHESRGLTLPDLEWRYSESSNMNEGNERSRSNSSTNISIPIPNTMKQSSMMHPEGPTVENNDNKDMRMTSINV